MNSSAPVHPPELFGILLAADLAGSGLVQYSIYAGAILLAAALAIAWAVYRPKRRKRKRRSSTRLNPTLAETRGLPPLRHERPNPPEEIQP